MAVEERIGRLSGNQFPVGMRVLAVDDDPVCLKLLEALLLRCKYHVTTTNQAITALKLLRENKDRFDLVISDVHMPDMDGFKLLELVGLEMDLPVIMLSVNGETKTVMKGIIHGACDYLLKPVRLEELKNIWQHVVRRRTLDRRDRCNYDNEEDLDKLLNGNCEGGQASVINGSYDRDARCNKRRKDQSDEEGFDSDENAHENEDSSSQKRPRVVWSIELHRKFVAAVNQLGIDKAVPKRILDLMNVEKLTRENVASHLQKYRLYLKRLSAVASQQANMAAAFGSGDSSYLHMSSMDGSESFHSLATSGQLPALAPFLTSGMVSRTNATNVGFHSFVTAGVAGHTQRPSPPINDVSRFQSISLPVNQQGGLLQGIPMPLEFQQSQHKRIQEPNNQVAGGFSGAGLPTGSSCSPFLSMSNAPLISRTREQQHSLGGFGNNSQLSLPSVSSEPVQVTSGFCSPVLNVGSCNDNLQGAGLFTGYAIKSLEVGASSNHGDLSVITANVSIPRRESSSMGISSSSVIVAPSLGQQIQTHAQCQPDSSIGHGNIIPTEDAISFNFGLSGSTNKRSLESIKDNLSEDLFFSSLASSTLPNNLVVDYVFGNQRTDKRPRNEIIDTNMVSHVNSGSSIITQSCKFGKSTTDGLNKYKNDYLLEASKFQGGAISSACTLNDLVSSMIKPERDDTLFLDSDICEFYPLGACM